MSLTDRGTAGIPSAAVRWKSPETKAVNWRGSPCGPVRLLKAWLAQLPARDRSRMPGIHTYRPVAVQALDAETRQPIPGATVRLWYPGVEPARAPYDLFRTTGDDGIAHLHAAPYGEGGVMMEVTAKGYLFAEKDLTVEAVQAIARLIPSRRSIVVPPTWSWQCTPSRGPRSS